MTGACQRIEKVMSVQIPGDFKEGEIHNLSLKTRHKACLTSEFSCN